MGIRWMITGKAKDIDRRRLERAYHAYTEDEDMDEAMEEHGGHEHRHMAKKEECPGLKRAKMVLRERPESWEQYEDKPDGYMKILEMELNELHTAKANLKSGTGDRGSVMHELGDVAAAAISAYTAMARKYD